MGRKVAVVGVGSTQYARDSGRSRGSLVLEACRLAIEDAGLPCSAIDGLAGNAQQAAPHWVQPALGVPALRWWVSGQVPFSLLLSDAAAAVASGLCQFVVVYQSAYRTGFLSRDSTRDDPVRAAPDPVRTTSNPFHTKDLYSPMGARTAQYAGFMRRYMYEYSIGRLPFARLAINSRSNAERNHRAVQRRPLTTDDYMSSRMVRDPMCLFDIDYAVDGADALVLTNSTTARAISERPMVLLDAISYGSAASPHDDLYRNVVDTGQAVAASALWQRTDLAAGDIDLLYLYDGYTIIAMKWIESLGLCGPGEGSQFVEATWSDAERRMLWRGRPVNSHGGNLSEGASQGAGHIREAVLQLRGEAGSHQATASSSALLGIGGLFHNASALTLVRD